MIIVQVAGRLGKDAETRFTPTGQKVTTLTLAATVRKAGKDETVWWRVTIWGERYDKMLPYLKKGAALIVVGEMHKPEIWTDKEGRSQVSVEMTAEIVKFSPFGNPERNAQDATSTSQSFTANQRNDSPQYSHSTQGSNANYSHSTEIDDEPLPF